MGTTMDGILGPVPLKIILMNLLNSEFDEIYLPFSSKKTDPITKTMFAFHDSCILCTKRNRINDRCKRKYKQIYIYIYQWNLIFDRNIFSWTGIYSLYRIGLRSCIYGHSGCATVRQNTLAVKHIL